MVRVSGSIITPLNFVRLNVQITSVFTKQLTKIQYQLKCKNSDKVINLLLKI